MRCFGDHSRTVRPGHSVGAYYYFLTTGRSVFRNTVARLGRSVMTRFHLRHPWYIPITLVAEMAGIVKAIGLYRGGRQLLEPQPGDR